MVLADRDGEDATLDVRDAAAVDALVAEVFARHARLDCLTWWRVLRLLSGVAPSLKDALARRELAKIRALLGE